MFGAVIFETMAVVAIFVLRRTMASAERPYRCPGYPVVPLLYVILPGFVLANMFVAQQFEVAAGLAFIAVGIGCYYAMGLNQPPVVSRLPGPAVLDVAGVRVDGSPHPGPSESIASKSDSVM